MLSHYLTKPHDHFTTYIQIMNRFSEVFDLLSVYFSGQTTRDTASSAVTGTEFTAKGDSKLKECLYTPVKIMIPVSI